MTKRLVWFVAGLVSGSVGTVYGYVRFRRSAARPIAERVGGVVGERARAGAAGARRLVEETKAQILAVESELAPDVDGEPRRRPSVSPTSGRTRASR